MDEHPWCEVCQSLGKDIQLATEIHHKAYRFGDLLFDKRYFASVCRPHHEYLHNNIAWAKKNGWIVKPK
jgi:hypothetical protein